MAITVTWGQKIINVSRADLTLIQSVPTEIREMDINWFRLELKDLEDSEDGMMFPDTHNHVAPLSVGGVTLSRSIEIINDYTITFEDGQYAVNLVGANSNIGDRVNVNQVSIRSANSAGLVTSAAIEYGEYGGGVTIDVINGETGTVYPIGTPRRPVNNINDAELIMSARGFAKLFIIGDITFESGDSVDNIEVEGINPQQTTITLNSGVSTDGTELTHSTVTGVLDGDTWITECVVQSLNYINGAIRDSVIVGMVTLSGTTDMLMANCADGDAGNENAPTINCDGGGRDLIIAKYSGSIKLTNATDSGDHYEIGMLSGSVFIDSTCTDGHAILSGIAVLTDNSGGSFQVETDSLLSKNSISDAIWDEASVDHLTAGTFGAMINQIKTWVNALRDLL